MCALPLLERARQRIKAAQGLESGETLRSGAFCNYTMLSEDVFMVSDALTDERFKNNPFVTGAPCVRSSAGAPFISLKNICLGALCLFNTKPRSFSRADEAELQFFADRVVKQGREGDRSSRAWAPSPSLALLFSLAPLRQFRIL